MPRFLPKKNNPKILAILPQTRTVIDEVERLSGRKVVVQEDPSLQTLATVRTARGGSPCHLVRYRTSGETVNYLIVYQLGFLVRLFSCPEAKRWELVSSSDEKTKGIDALGLSDLPAQLAPSLFDNLITQLRTYSVGMRIDEWVRREFPELRSEQVTSVQQQLSQNEQALAPEIRDRFPRRMVDANSSMNAAYASFWSDHLEEPRYVVPFAALGYGEIAAELRAVLSDVPDDPVEDRVLVENWARILVLSDFFHFGSSAEFVWKFFHYWLLEMALSSLRSSGQAA